MCSHCCLFYLFSLLVCCYIVFICLLFIPWLFQNRSEKQSLVLHQSLASWTHNEATADMTALWPSVRHPQIGPCWSYIRVQCRKEAVECSLFLFLRLRWPSPSGCPASSCLSITSMRWPGGRQRRHFHVKLACAENRNINKNIYAQPLSKCCINKWLSVQPSEA